MEYSAVPLFKSHYSLGKSILTLAKAGSSEEDEPSSVIDIAKNLQKNISRDVENMTAFNVEAVNVEIRGLK